MFGDLTPSEIEDLLRSRLVGRIGCHSEGKTYVVPISYAYADNQVYVHTHEGMKLRFMRQNPEVCFQVDEMDHMGNWKSVIGWGRFEELSGADREQALQILMNRVLPVISSETMHISPNWPFPPAEGEVIPGVVFRITLREKTGRFEKSQARR